MGNIGTPTLALRSYQMVPSTTGRGDYVIFTYLDIREVSTDKYGDRGIRDNRRSDGDLFIPVEDIACSKGWWRV